MHRELVFSPASRVLPGTWQERQSSGLNAGQQLSILRTAQGGDALGTELCRRMGIVRQLQHLQRQSVARPMCA